MTLNSLLLCALALALLLVHAAHVGDIITSIIEPIHTNGSECDATLARCMYDGADGTGSTIWAVGDGCGIEYIPTIELSVRTELFSAADAALLLLTFIMLAHTSVSYILCVRAYARTFMHESVAPALLMWLLIIACATAYTDQAWATAHTYAPTHNYSEYGTYEFDTELSVQRYVFMYVSAAVTHATIFASIRTTQVLYIIAIILTFLHVGAFVVVYIAILIQTFTAIGSTIAIVFETLRG